MSTEPMHKTTPMDVAHFWHQQIEQWKQSNLSQTQFCKANDLIYHRFVYWRQKLTPPPGNQTVSVGTNGFAMAALEPSTETGLSLSLPNGLVIRGIHADNVSVVHPLLAQL